MRTETLISRISNPVVNIMKKEFFQQVNENMTNKHSSKQKTEEEAWKQYFYC